MDLFGLLRSINSNRPWAAVRTSWMLWSGQLFGFYGRATLTSSTSGSFRSLECCLIVMYIENWDSFYQQALHLYRTNPIKARYVTKYRHCDGKLVLKVTDDATVSCTPQQRCWMVEQGQW